MVGEHDRPAPHYGCEPCAHFDLPRRRVVVQMPSGHCCRLGITQHIRTMRVEPVIMPCPSYVRSGAEP